MTSPSTLSFYMMEADSQIPRESRFFGLNDPSVAGLRAFIRYHKDARVDLELGGRLRSLTHKQMAIAGLVARIAVTQERATVTSMAKEANVVPSTVSRFLLKLQCWNAYAIDVTRGRNGGVRIRLRAIGDKLAAYAERAWSRIKQAAEKALSRTKLNVASTSFDKERGYPTTTTVMDATFSEVPGGWRPCYLRDCSGHDDAPLPQSHTARDADAEMARAEAFARDVIAERRRLDAEDPDWDIYLDNVRSSYGLS